MAGLCPSISSLSLSQEGQSALRDIQKITKDIKKIRNVITGGSLLAIFFNDRVAINIINIASTDWKVLTQALQGLSDVQQRLIDRITYTQAERSKGGAEYEFWKAFYNHCRAN